MVSKNYRGVIVRKHDVFDLSYLEPFVLLDEWCKIYSLEVKTKPCLNCGEPRSTTKPAFGKTWRGLVAPPCACGFDGPFSHYVLTDNAEVDTFLNSFVPSEDAEDLALQGKESFDLHDGENHE